MHITEDEIPVIRQASNDYKTMVSKPDHSGEPGLNNKFEALDFYSIVADNMDDFRIYILGHNLLEKYGYKSIKQAFEESYALFMYCFQEFINSHTGVGLTAIKSLSSTNMIVDTIDEDKENKKEFLKEVMEGIEPKKYLKDFLDDPRSYKQFLKDVQNAMFYIDFDKIHRVMKKLKWTWCYWEDEAGDVHRDEIPTAFALRETVIQQLNEMEMWINEHPEDTWYRVGTGGFEYEAWVCDHEDDEPDDYDHRVRLVIRFVAEQYDGGM